MESKTENNDRDEGKPTGTKPGDNPNLRRAKVSKQYRPSRQNVKKNVLNIAENVEPRKTPINLVNDQFRDQRKVGTRIVGSFDLRPEMFTELIAYTTSCMQSQLDRLEIRQGVVDHLPSLSEFMVRYSVATQLYETLVISQQEGMPYKLKALKYGSITIPNFLIPFVQSLGSFNTHEGIVICEDIESHVMRETALAILAASNLDHVYVRLPATFTAANLKRAVWETSQPWHSQVTSLSVRLGLNQSFTTGDLPISIDWKTITVSAIKKLIEWKVFPLNQQAHANALIDLRDNGTFASFIRNTPFCDGNTIFSDKVMVTLISNIFPSFNNHYSGWCESAFISSKFQPSKSGTSAQFVKPSDDTLSYGQHDYSISSQEAAVGLILLPSKRVEFEPKYSTTSEFSRQQLFFEFASTTKSGTK